MATNTINIKKARKGANAVTKQWYQDKKSKGYVGFYRKDLDKRTCLRLNLFWQRLLVDEPEFGFQKPNGTYSFYRMVPKRIYKLLSEYYDSIK